MHTFGVDTPGRESCGQIAQKRSRSAQIEICVARHPLLLDYGRIKVAECVEVRTQAISRERSTVPYMTPAPVQTLE
jgi:hypothetical protein